MRYAVCLLIFAVCCDARYVPKDGIYAVAEVMPEYSEGMKAFNQHIQTSLKSSDSTNPGDYTTGQVMVSFIVNTDGSLSEMKVMRGINDFQDEAALKAIQSAPYKWNPGINQGKPVNVKLTYPVKYQ
jgi:protein TonB